MTHTTLFARRAIVLPSPRRRGEDRARGFTIIELLVAMTGAMFVAIAAFAMAKQGSRFFQQEARIANAQYSATVGFDRLRADIARAGFLSTPNIGADPRVCPGGPTVDRGLPGISTLAAVRFEPGQPSEAQDTTNHLSPDRLLLSGSYASAELFPMRALVRNDESKAVDVYLQMATGAVARTTGQSGTGALLNLFAKGRILRLLEQSTGRFAFGAITASSYNETDKTVIVSLAGTPEVPFRRAGSSCGIQGLGVGTQASVISWVQYDLRKLAQMSPLPAGYAAFVNETSSEDGDAERLYLMRQELDYNLQPNLDSLELVAEYAVDLRFAFLGLSPTLPVTATPTLVRYAFGDDTNNKKFAGYITTDAARPDRIRSVQVRLAVRSREADRQVDLPRPGGGNLFRYLVPGTALYARTRTVTSEVHLPNMAGVMW